MSENKGFIAIFFSSLWRVFVQLLDDLGRIGLVLLAIWGASHVFPSLQINYISWKHTPKAEMQCDVDRGGVNHG